MKILNSHMHVSTFYLDNEVQRGVSTTKLLRKMYLIRKHTLSLFASFFLIVMRILD